MITKLIQRFFRLHQDEVKVEQKPRKIDRLALLRINTSISTRDTADADKYSYKVALPRLLPIVTGGRNVGIACDSAFATTYASPYSAGGFAGYAEMANLGTRPEFSAISKCLSREYTRKWIEFKSVSGDESGAERIEAIQKEFERLDVRGCVRLAAVHDTQFGRAQIVINIRGADPESPLILSPHCVQVGALESIAVIEPMWTTPDNYNSTNPFGPDFYRPDHWWVLGSRCHATRLLTFVTNPISDILKPAFNFGGYPLFQAVSPYIDNFREVQEATTAAAKMFSTTVFSTNMSQVLQGGGDDDDSSLDASTGLIERIKLFIKTRNNQGVFVVDKEDEELNQVNMPISGLSEIQSQALEQVCCITGIPAHILLGVSPSGLNSSREDETRVFYEKIHAEQEAHYRHNIDFLLKVVQLNLFGGIDESITFDFVPLKSMSEKEVAEINQIDANTAATYIGAGVVAPEEVREKIAKAKLSGYNGLDLDSVVSPKKVAV